MNNFRKKRARRKMERWRREHEFYLAIDTRLRYRREDAPWPSIDLRRAIKDFIKKAPPGAQVTGVHRDPDDPMRFHVSMSVPVPVERIAISLTIPENVTATITTVDKEIDGSDQMHGERSNPGE